MNTISRTSQEWVPVGVNELEPNADTVIRSNKNYSVIAGPGAGKTELLAQRACYLLQTGKCPYPYRILAISFKQDSAKNLKDRVNERCSKKDALRFDSLTFDAFAKSMLDRFMGALPKIWQPTQDYEIYFPIIFTYCKQRGKGKNNISSLYEVLTRGGVKIESKS